ncbi:MerR family transcriptional regulator [Frankia sp. QA3]|uniref:MerR family transcriptional regulator n=1 Tax=Frankia sp. QA3 TaxID=710111 RepID=UPI000269C3AB|nr:MerR family transcriptional regulator [Frankia sp. QA3]EIV94741.1 putative transcriptional regulator [Frankia sp. QA3]
MRIGELARRAQVSGRALRYYEEQGLLTPDRQPSGYRDYGEADVETVRRIRVLLAAGLPTSIIAEVLPCMVDAAGPGGALAPGCPELLPHLEGERDRIAAAIADLTAAHRLLAAVIAATPAMGATPGACAPADGT